MFGFADKFDDDALSAHDSELDRMKGFYSDNEDVYKLIEKREKLWSKHLEFEVHVIDSKSDQTKHDTHFTVER